MYKNLKTTFLALIIGISTAIAQVPNMINYQGVAHDTSGTPIANQLIKVRLKIHDATIYGPVLYSEVRKLTTDPSGLFNIKIGSTGANSTTGSWAAITWDNGLKYLQVEIDPAGGNTYVNMGSQQLLSVPYAQHAQSAAALSGSATIHPNQINNGGATIGQVLQYDGANWLPTTIATGGTLSLPQIIIDPNLVSLGITNTSAIGGSAIYGKTTTNSSTACGIRGESTGAQGNGVYGKSSGASSFGVLGENSLGIGVNGISNIAGYAGVQGINQITGGKGVVGIANNGTNSIGVVGNANAGIGVSGYSNSNVGVSGGTISGTALYGLSSTGYALEANGKVKISGGNTTPGAGKVLTSDATGNAVWKENKVAFKAGYSTTSYANNTLQQLTYNTEVYDKSNNFDINTDIFTAPVSGVYHFSAATEIYLASMVYNMQSAAIFICVKRNGTEWQESEARATIGTSSTGSTAPLNIGCDVTLLQGDQVFIRAKQYNSNGLTGSNNSISTSINYFCGHLVFAD